MSLPGVRTALNVNRGHGDIADTALGAEGIWVEVLEADSADRIFGATSSRFASLCGNGRSRWDFSLVDQTKMVTAAERAGAQRLGAWRGGTVDVESLEQRITPRPAFDPFSDQGAGIDWRGTGALKDGYTTSRRHGIRTGWAKRLVTNSKSSFSPGAGARKVMIVRWRST